MQAVFTGWVFAAENGWQKVCTGPDAGRVEALTIEAATETREEFRILPAGRHPLDDDDGDEEDERANELGRPRRR